MCGWRFQSVFALLAAVAFCTTGCKESINTPDTGNDAMVIDQSARVMWEKKMLADPLTGEIPENIRARELAFASTLPVNHITFNKRDAEATWQSRGPWNLGGRTRALALDATNENIILAAGVSGGIWRSVNGGANWRKVTLPHQLANVTCLVQDTRKNKTHIWYAGTGELIGNSASGRSAFFLGDGILKSTDGGLSWHSLAATTSGKPQNLSRNFNLVNTIAINLADTGDVVYAATYGSVYRSDNGGEKWSVVRGGTGLITPSYYTGVAVTPKGVIYATLSSDGSQKGIWRSADGKEWTNITPAGFATHYNRIEIGIDPTNENNVYFLGYTPNGGKRSVDFRGKEDWASFWKYTYIGSDGNGLGGKWEDRSQNLPDFGGYFGDFNTQTGYNMFVRIKPDAPNTIYLGSTNLWRSTDGFTSNKNTSWIGGYAVNTTMPNYEMYPNQHPDQHNLVFYPSNPNKMIAACDGGLFRTDNNTAANVTWESLNNGYLTSQFYTIAIDHATPGDNEILGGLQDNGTYFTRSANPQTAGACPAMAMEASVQLQMAERNIMYLNRKAKCTVLF